MPRRFVGAFIVFSLLLLVVVQAAQAPQVDILRQYQKIQGESKYFRHFSYEDGAPKGNSYSSMVDNFGYLWIGTYPTQVHRFNGISFMDVLALLPPAERDSLFSFPLSQDNDKHIYLAGRHYLYRWNGYRLLKYVFPKDDRIIEYKALNNKLLAVGNHGYAILNHDNPYVWNYKWTYTRVPITHQRVENQFYLNSAGLFYAQNENHKQEFSMDSNNRLYKLHYGGKGSSDNTDGLTPPVEDFNISRYSAAGIETLPCLSSAEKNELFSQAQLDFSPVFKTTPQSEISVVFTGTEYHYLLDTKQGSFRRETLHNCKFLSCGSDLGAHRKLLVYSKSDTLFISKISPDGLGFQTEYYYTGFRSDRNYRIAYDNDWLEVNYNYSQQTEVLKTDRGLANLQSVDTPGLNSQGEDNYGWKNSWPLYGRNHIVYAFADPKFLGVHTVCQIDVAKNTCQTRQVADEAQYLSVVNYNANNNSILLAGKDGIFQLSQTSVAEKLYGFPKMDARDIPHIFKNHWGTIAAIDEWIYPESKFSTRLLIDCMESIKELPVSGYIMNYHISNEKPLLELLMHDHRGPRIETINLETGKIISQAKIEKLHYASYFGETAIYLDKDLNFSMRSPYYPLIGNLNAVTQPWFELLDKHLIVRDILPQMINPSLIDERTLFFPSEEYTVTNSENGHSELGISTYTWAPIPPDKIALSGSPPQKFQTAALIYDCRTQQVFERPNWVRAFAIHDSWQNSWQEKTKIVYIDKQKEGKALRISDYEDKELKPNTRDFVFPLKDNYLPEYKFFIDGDLYFPLINKMLYYQYKGVWAKLNTRNKPQYGELKDVNWDNDELWLVYDSALIRFSLSTGQSFVFTSRDGLPDELMSMLEVWRKQHLLTSSGIYAFSPRDENSTLNIPWLVVNGLKTSVDKVNKFSHKQNNIIIPVDILNSLFPERFKLSYRLTVNENMYSSYLGYENGWKQRDFSPQIEYPKLPPGHYVFRIYATSPTGQKGKTVSVPFIIKTPLYGTWWAFVIYACLFVWLGGHLYLLRIRQFRRRNEVLEQTVTLRTQELEEGRQRIQASIEYALRIQKSILPQASDLAKEFKEHFIIWKPRDIVGGDFYWLHTLDSGEVMLAMIDCTGHGVPGALLSTTVNSLLENLVHDRVMHQPADILSEMHRRIGSILHQDKANTMQDGIEISLLKIDPVARQVVFCGAHLDLLHYDVETRQLDRIRGNSYGLGGLKQHQERQFEQQQLSFTDQSRFYLYTDGIIDQPVERQNKKRRLGNSGWIELVSVWAGLPLDEQEKLINERLKTMFAYHQQRDDITIIGLRI